MRTWNLGDKVTVTPEVNSVWCGDGVIYKKYTHTDKSVSVRMLTGLKAGQVGGFKSDELIPTEPKTPEVYLCADEDGDWFAFEGSVDEIPDGVTEVYAPGRKLAKQARWV